MAENEISSRYRSTFGIDKHKHALSVLYYIFPITITQQTYLQNHHHDLRCLKAPYFGNLIHHHHHYKTNRFHPSSVVHQFFRLELVKVQTSKTCSQVNIQSI